MAGFSYQKPPRSTLNTVDSPHRKMKASVWKPFLYLRLLIQLLPWTSKPGHLASENALGLFESLANATDRLVQHVPLAAERHERPKLTLTNLPYEIRRSIYREFFEVRKAIHLTQNIVTKNSRPAKYYITRDGSNLTVACRQISDEIADLIYGSNTFVLEVGEINYNKGMLPFPHSNSTLWLTGLRQSIIERVQLLRVSLPLPRKDTIRNISQGLSFYPKVEITIASLDGVTGMAWVTQRDILKLLCETVMNARDGKITIWNDLGEIVTAHLFLEALPVGVLTTGRTAIEMLDEIDAWR